MNMSPEKENLERAGAVEILERSGSLTVYRCAHGRVHLQLGTVTLRLTRDEFWHLAQGVGAAFVRMSAREVVDHLATYH
jgi:hypothetical protein